MNLRKNIHILYYGDFGPSGEMMDGATTNRLINVKVWKMKEYAENRGLTFDLKRIAITKKQIIDYDLPWDPEQMSNEVQEKLENDPRYRTMLRQHGQV